MIKITTLASITAISVFTSGLFLVSGYAKANILGANNQTAHSTQKTLLAKNVCNSVTGNWSWDTRAFPAIIYDDGTVHGEDDGRELSGNWICKDASNGLIEVHWSSGAIDYLRYDSDSDTLAGHNSLGSNVTAVRR